MRTVLAVLAILLAASPGRGDPPLTAEPPTPAAVVPADAEPLLTAWSRAMDGATGLAVQVRCTTKPDASSERPPATCLLDLVFRKPNQFRALAGNERLAVQIYSDGERVCTYLPLQKRYLIETAPSAPASPATLTNGWRAAAAIAMGGLDILPVLMATNARAMLLEDVTRVEPPLKADLDGRAATRLLLRQKRMDIDAWFLDQDPPVMLRLQPKSTKPGESGTAKADVEVDVRLLDWRLNAAVAAETFRFAPPPDAAQARARDDLLGLVPATEPRKNDVKQQKGRSDETGL